jgi:hypothetical protein
MLQSEQVIPISLLQVEQGIENLSVDMLIA